LAFGQWLSARLFLYLPLIPAPMEFSCWVFSQIGTGLAILQTAANPYITVLGSKERAAQRISLMGICNKGAGILAPLIFAAVILKATDTDLFKELSSMHEAARNIALNELIQRVIVPYTVVGTALFVFGLMIRYSPLPEINTEHESVEVAAINAGKKNIFQFPHLVLCAIAIFLHVGTQVVAIDTIIGYANSMHINLLEAKVFPSYTLAANYMRLCSRHPLHSTIYPAGKCVAILYFTGNYSYFINSV